MESAVPEWAAAAKGLAPESLPLPPGHPGHQLTFPTRCLKKAWARRQHSFSHTEGDSRKLCLPRCQRNRVWPSESIINHRDAARKGRASEAGLMHREPCGHRRARPQREGAGHRGRVPSQTFRAASATALHVSQKNFLVILKSMNINTHLQ